jgi:hypothetical protein
MAHEIGHFSLGYEQPGITFDKSLEEQGWSAEAAKDALKGTGFHEEGAETDWGATSISKNDFINPDGSPKSVKEIYQILDSKLPNITGKALENQIRQMLPKYQGVSKEERGFLEEETAQAFKGDVYGLQREAGKVGGAMGSVYGGGMGAGMRSGMAGQASLGKEFGMAEDAYDLAKRKGMYRLEEGAKADYERDIESWIDPEWMKADLSKPVETTAWGNFRGGGRVPNKDETFLHFLTQLPDAGGS